MSSAHQFYPGWAPGFMDDFLRTSHPFPQTWRRRSFSTGQINVTISSFKFNFFLLPEQNAPASQQQHAFLASFLPIILNLLQLKYQGEDVSAFEAHPVITGIAIATLFLYWLAYDAELNFSSSSSSAAAEQHHPKTSTFAQFVCRGKSLFGSLLMASLASLFLPAQLQPVLYVFCLLILAAKLLQNWRIHHCRLSRNRGSLLPLHLPNN